MGGKLTPTTFNDISSGFFLFFHLVLSVGVLGEAKEGGREGEVEVENGKREDAC